MANWAARRKFLIFSIIVGFFAVIISIIVFLNWPKPSCSDKKQNQNEEGVDCGGVCTPCIVAPEDIVTSWSRIFEVGDGVYEAVSLVQNPNLYYAMPRFKYTFKVYDDRNLVASVKEGETFINPADKFLVLEGGILAGKRKLVKAIMTIEYLSDWQYVNKNKPPLIVSEKKFSNDPFGSLQITITNQSLVSAKNVWAAAVLNDESGNAIGANLSKMDAIAGESSREVTFTWPKPFAQEPASSEIYIRSDFINGN